MNFIYVIYEKKDGNILDLFDDETECIEIYKEYFDKDNCDWRAINLQYIIMNDIIKKGGEKMTNEEYLAIVENPSKTLTLKELFYILHKIKIDAEQELAFDRNITIEKMRWLCGEINGLDIAINLIEHLEEEKKND